MNYREGSSCIHTRTGFARALVSRDRDDDKAVFWIGVAACAVQKSYFGVK